MITYRFTNYLTKKTVDVDAIDGHTAWKQLKATPIYLTGVNGIISHWDIGQLCVACGEYAGKFTLCNAQCFDSVLVKRGA